MPESTSPIGNSASQKLSLEEKRRERIQRLENKLQLERNRLSSQQRKDRTGQLISWGVMVEILYRKGTPEQRQQVMTWAQQYLTDERNITRVREGFTRLDDEINELAQQKGGK